jgi:uncharacterized protein YndB with AHSA1/START domain
MPLILCILCLFLAATPILGAKADSPSRLGGVVPGKTETGRAISLSMSVGCPPDVAERMWSTVDGVKSFFAPHAKIGDVGGPYELAFYPKDDPQGRRYGTAGARVLAREPGRFFAFEWVTFAADAHKGRGAPPAAAPERVHPDVLPTWVELTFLPQPSQDGTQVELRHHGFGDDALWRESHTYFVAGWSGVLDRMRTACD